MENNQSTGDPETKFEEGTFGYLVEHFSPVGLAIRAELEGDSSGEYREKFANMKGDFLALCSNPNVSISPKQRAFISGFLYEIYQFPNGKLNMGQSWVNVDHEKQIVLATYINTLR